MRHNVNPDGASMEHRSVHSPAWRPEQVRIRTGGHVCEEKRRRTVKRSKRQKNAWRRRTKQVSQNVVEADRQRADRFETMYIVGPVTDRLNCGQKNSQCTNSAREKMTNSVMTRIALSRCMFFQRQMREFFLNGRHKV